MRNHLIYFYSSTDFYHKQNQIIGIDDSVDNLELIKFGKICYDSVNNDGSIGQTGTMFPKNITIIPFSILYKEELIIKQLEDVLTANEYYIKANTIDFPLMKLKNAVRFFYRGRWCCVGHYYLSLLNIALHNKGYSSKGIESSGLVSNFHNTLFTKTDGTRLKINAEAGM
ncbi:MAG: hypothetical protein EAZ75_06395 [Flavobacteriia bacterium]|jgi:hypothetical protein|uniref:hypothetical protein n=1 Tax=Flavobacterium sp. TaxID=239 RepID=UPI0029708B9B|nr:MAG: hypothetical protein EAZ75_06395 [Flavobacteriia bacterium]